MSAIPYTPGELALELASVQKLPTRPVIFFDGVCGLCNWSIDFLLKRDRQEQFLFAPLQGETARQILPDQDVASLGSVVYWQEGRMWRKSAAVVRILWRLGGRWRFLAVLLWLIPLPLRNLGYRVVAGNRYRWFGQKSTCRMPTPAERARFLP